MPVADSAAMQVSTPTRRFVRRRRASMPSFMKDRAAREEALREQLQSRLQAARERSDEVLGLVRDETLYERPIPERHRLIFYLGHLEAFDWNLLLPRQPRARPVPARPRSAVRVRHRPARQRPARATARRTGPPSRRSAATAACLRDAVDGALETTPLLRPIHPNLEAGWAFGLAIEHRLMHAETLAYLLHQLPSASKGPGPLPPVPVRPRRRAGSSRSPPDARRSGSSRATAPHARLGQRVRGARGRRARLRDRVVTTSRTATSCASSPPAAISERSLWSDDDWAWRGRAAASTRPSGCGARATGATARCSARCRSARRGRCT